MCVREGAWIHVDSKVQALTLIWQLTTRQLLKSTMQMTLRCTVGRFHQKWVQQHRVERPRSSQSNQCPQCLMGRGQACPWGQSRISVQQGKFETKSWSDQVQVLTSVLSSSLTLRNALKKSMWGRTRWWRSRWTWTTSLSMDTLRKHLQRQKCLQNTSWELAGVPDHWKRIYRTTQNSVGWRN